ncbi:MAG TPA: translocation/assembly module TamB domain-containing protein, partial [Rhodothermales bacterium]
VKVRGAVSSVPGDTVVIDVSNIAVHQVARAFAGPQLGGFVDGRIALTGGLLRPELTGRIDVRHLRFDNRLLGDLTLRSRYVPGSPDVQIDAEIAPSSVPPPATVVGTTRPLLVEENALRLSGRFRMPQFDERGRQVLSSALDLRLDAERIDAFFFEYIFKELSDVGGYISGGGTITGSLNDPEFDLALHLADASFTVADYNLRFTAETDGFIDRRGIHIRDGHVRDKTGGTGLVNGSILFNDYRYFSFDLAARLNEIQIMDVTDANRGLSFYGRIWASCNATLTGPLNNALLQSADVVTAPRSEVYIPLMEVASATDPGFILFADSAGNIPDVSRITRRENILARRPIGERPFVDALGMDLNIFAPPGSTVHLVIDPLLGDMMNAVGTGRIQLVRSEGEYLTFGSLDVSGGDYLFTAGDVFVRRFLIDEGTIRWDGDPTDAQLDVWASYRTRASTAGLPGLGGDAESAPLVPLLVRLHITARVSSPSVELSLALERRDQDVVGQGLEAILNDPERSTQYATSVLLTNTFLLTTDQFAEGEAGGNGTRSQFAFNSVSQLVASQINRYLSYALPNVDVNFGLQGERAQDLDVTYGVALRLMDERLVIRGEGVYQNDQQNPTRGEFLVQVRLSPSVSVEVFYRREGDVLSDQTLTNTTGAGVSYETRFSNWDRLMRRLFGWARGEESADQEEEEAEEPVVVGVDR